MIIWLLTVYRQNKTLWLKVFEICVHGAVWEPNLYNTKFKTKNFVELTDTVQIKEVCMNGCPLLERLVVGAKHIYLLHSGAKFWTNQFKSFKYIWGLAFSWTRYWHFHDVLREFYTLITWLAWIVKLKLVDLLDKFNSTVMACSSLHGVCHL